MASGKPIRQPKVEARSLMMVVRKPITPSDRMNAGHPPRYLAGGTNANSICRLGIMVLRYV